MSHVADCSMWISDEQLQEANQLAFHKQDRDLSPAPSTSQSQQEMTTSMTGNASQEQCFSSESDGSCAKHVESQTKPVLFMGHPDLSKTPSQIDFNQSTNQVVYPCVDPYYGQLFTAYGPPAMIQPQMVGALSPRVPLPPELALDGPIYVNSKQYHAILRRRQTRAKLEARNKLIKARKPYLHESRHLHAVKRVRGSGGRFLSTKNLQQTDPSGTSASSQCMQNSVASSRKVDVNKYEAHHHQQQQSESGKWRASPVTTTNDIFFQQPDHRFSNIASHDLGKIGYPAPVVR